MIIKVELLSEPEDDQISLINYQASFRVKVDVSTEDALQETNNELTDILTTVIDSVLGITDSIIRLEE